MTDETKVLSDEQVSNINGGVLDPGGAVWERYTDTSVTVRCPKCGRKDNIWYVEGIFGIRDFNSYECRDCDFRFQHFQNPASGANGSW